MISFESLKEFWYSKKKKKKLRGNFKNLNRKMQINEAACDQFVMSVA